MITPRTEFLSGLKAELPIAIGVIPFGLIYGVLALSAGILPGAAQSMSAIVFAGSAQFISAQLIGHSTPAIIVVLTVGVVNLRHVLYSASLAPSLQGLPVRWKLLLGYLLTDEAYAVTIMHNTEPGEAQHRHWFFLSSGLLLWVTWQISTAAGIFLGAAIPSSWSLDFTLALTFVGLVVPAIKDRASLAAALSAGVASMLVFSLPFKLGLMAASLAGILAGLLVEGKR